MVMFCGLSIALNNCMLCVPKMSLMILPQRGMEPKIRWIMDLLTNCKQQYQDYCRKVHQKDLPLFTNAATVCCAPYDILISNGIENIYESMLQL